MGEASTKRPEHLTFADHHCAKRHLAQGVTKVSQRLLYAVSIYSRVRTTKLYRECTLTTEEIRLCLFPAEHFSPFPTCTERDSDGSKVRLAQLMMAIHQLPRFWLALSLVC
jgi:hypothetical protein